MKTTVAIIGEYDPDLRASTAIQPAIQSSAEYLGHQVEVRWVSPRETLELEGFGGVWLSAGAPYADFDATLDLIRMVRENRIPCLGTCRGFHYMVLEFARNVLREKDVGHEEADPLGENLFLTRLPPSARKSHRQVTVAEGTQIAPAYYRPKAIELFYGKFGVNPVVEEKLSKAGFVSMASEYSGNYRIAGIPSHRFFIGTLFLPQLRASPDSPHPVVTAFLKNALLNDQEKRPG